VVIEENYFDEIKKRHPQNFNKWFKTFTNRASVTYMVKSGVISFQSELILFGKNALLVDWNNSVAIEIRHPEIFKMLFDLFRNFQLIGKKIEYINILKKTNN
jgi:hypothetical protein